MRESLNRASSDLSDEYRRTADRVLREARIESHPIAIEASQEEGILKEKFGAEREVPQSHAKVSEREVLWSDGFLNCSAVILRAPSGVFMLIHAEAGQGYPLIGKPSTIVQDAERFVKSNPGTKMIIVRRQQQFLNRLNLKLGFALLGQLQVPLVKIVEVEAVWPASGVAYDPVADQIFVDQRGIEKLMIFSGFGSPGYTTAST